MAEEKTDLHKRIETGKPILIAEISPPISADPDPVRTAARDYAQTVDALAVSDNRDGVSMSALAAAWLVKSAGVEPILHVATRDRNRIALIADVLGAQAMGIRNMLCTSGTHQTLGRAKAAGNVFDIDSIQLLQAYANLADDGAIVGEGGIAGAGPFCLGAVAAPYADPMEIQILRLGKKVSAGANFLITQPVFDLDRFGVWWEHVVERGLDAKVAIVAGIKPLTDADTARAYAEKRPVPMVPDTVLERIGAKTEKAAQRAAGIDIALETIDRLSTVDGLRGFEICANGDDAAAMEIIEKSRLGID